MMGVLTLPSLEDLDVPDATFACPDLTTFCRLDELGLEVTGQRVEPDRALLGVSDHRRGSMVSAVRRGRQPARHRDPKLGP